MDSDPAKLVRINVQLTFALKPPLLLHSHFGSGAHLLRKIGKALNDAMRKGRGRDTNVDPFVPNFLEF